MNRVVIEDSLLCQKMIVEGKTLNEKRFFTEILKKEKEEVSLSGDLLLSENENELGIYILRELYDEFRVGVYKKGPDFPELHVDGIDALLRLPLKDIGISEDKTLGQWLREIDYKGINYKANADIF